MTTAIVLLNVAAAQTKMIAEVVAAIPGVTEVYSVAGNFDLVAIIRVSDEGKLADVVTEKIRAVSGIQSSQTLIAFRAYSQHDLNLLFDMN